MSGFQDFLPLRAAPLLCLLLLAARPGHAEGPNLVVNGSFEDDFTGWTQLNSPASFPASIISYGPGQPYPDGAYGEAVGAANAPTNSPDPAGEHGLYFVSDLAAAETIQQTVFLEAGIYQIGFSAYLPANGQANAGEAVFTGVVAGETLATFKASSVGAKRWASYQGATTINEAGAYKVAFTFSTSLRPSKDVVVDQVYIIKGNPPVPIPAPGGLALLVPALAGLALLQRR